MTVPSARSEGPWSEDPIPPSPLLYEEPVETTDVRAYFAELWRKKYVLVAVTLGSALLAAAIGMQVPRRYATEALIVMTLPTYMPPARPEPLPVEAYVKLAGSDYILSLTESELRAARPDLFPSGDSAERLANFSPRAAAGRDWNKLILPLFAVRAETDTPEKAMLAVNTWADVIVREQSRMSEGRSTSTEHILSEYAKAEQSLKAAENALLQQRNAQARAATEAELALSSKSAELESVEDRIVSLEGLIEKAATDGVRLKSIIAALQKELEATPEPGQNQQVNLVRAGLSQELVRLRAELSVLVPQVASHELQIATARKNAAALRAALLDGRRRLAEQERVHVRDNAVLLRDVENWKKTADKLTGMVTDATLAQSMPAVDLKVAARAVLPRKPSGPPRSLNVIAASVLAFSVTAIYLFFASAAGARAASRDRLRRHRDLQDVQRDGPAARM
jgi:hypothetical protein